MMNEHLWKVKSHAGKCHKMTSADLKAAWFPGHQIHNDRYIHPGELLGPDQVPRAPASRATQKRRASEERPEARHTAAKVPKEDRSITVYDDLDFVDCETPAPKLKVKSRIERVIERKEKRESAPKKAPETVPPKKAPETLSAKKVPETLSAKKAPETVPAKKATESVTVKKAPEVSAQMASEFVPCRRMTLPILEKISASLPVPAKKAPDVVSTKQQATMSAKSGSAETMMHPLSVNLKEVEACSGSRSQESALVIKKDPPKPKYISPDCEILRGGDQGEFDKEDTDRIDLTREDDVDSEEGRQDEVADRKKADDEYSARSSSQSVNSDLTPSIHSSSPSPCPEEAESVRRILQANATPLIPLSPLATPVLPLKGLLDRQNKAREKIRKWKKEEEKALNEVREKECSIWRNRYSETLKMLDREREMNAKLRKEPEAEKEEKEMAKALLKTINEDFMQQQSWKDQCQRARSQLSEVSAICTAKEEELEKVRKELEGLKKRTNSEKYEELMKAMRAYTHEEP